MKIGILQTGHAPDALLGAHGDYDALFRALLGPDSFDYITWNVVDGAFPDGPDAADGWLITGSKHGAYDDLPWIAPLETLIRAIRDGGQPLVGVCFGHQIIAQALGGRVEKFPGGWSVGRQAYRMGEDTVHLMAWHQDQVVALPPGAEVIGSSDFCPYAMLAIGPRIWTVQAHPEFGPGFIDGLIRTRGPGVVPAPLLNAAAAELDKPLDRDAIAARMAAVLRQSVPA